MGIQKDLQIEGEKQIIQCKIELAILYFDRMDGWRMDT